jgi:hypothetical protein
MFVFGGGCEGGKDILNGPTKIFRVTALSTFSYFPCPGSLLGYARPFSY